MDKQQSSKKAVIYVRVSTTEQVDEGNSLATQERACREYAKRQGYDVVTVFVEKGESAKTANRTELRKLLEYCSQKKNGIGYVIVYKIDRLSRNTDDYSQIRLLLKRYQVSIKSSTEQIEDTPAGRLMENMMANISQFDNDVRAERCVGGMREAMREGRYVWMAPVGYSNVRDSFGRATIAPNEMAALVQRSFELVATCMYSTDEVWRMMTETGLRLKSGKPLSKTYFHDILRNRLYTGLIEKFGEQHQGVSPFEPIVSAALFNHVQRALKNKGHKVSEYKTDNPDFPLRRFISSVEGLKLTGSFAKGKYPYYRFGAAGCNYERDEFERKFRMYMDTYAFSDKHIGKLKSRIKEKYYKATANERTRKQRLQERVQELEVNQGALIQKNISGVISDFVLQKQLAQIEKEVTDIETMLAMMQVIETSPEEAIAFAEGYLTQPSTVWRTAKLPLKLKLQWFQFPRGMTFDGKNFGTPEISIVFKAKDLLSLQMSTSVDSDLEFWNHFALECVRLGEILRDNENEPSKEEIFAFV